MSKNNDYDFIKSMLEKENIKAPDSISAESIKAKLDNQIPPKNLIKLRKNKTPFKAMLAAAACFAIVLTSTIGVNAATNRVVERDGVNYYSSYGAVEKTIRKIDGYGSIIDGIGYGAKAESAMDAVDLMTVEESNTNSHSETIIQEAGVDEADVVKTDGKYIYYLNDDKIVIYSVNSGRTKIVSTIICESGFFNEMYITGNYLTVLAYDYGNGGYYGMSEKGVAGDKDDEESDKAVAYVYDITDRTEPKLLHTNVQDGFYYTSRMIGTYLYTISTYNIYYYDDRKIPYVTCNGKYQRIDCKDISGFTNPSDLSYTVISAMDITTGKNSVKTKAVLGGSNNIYVSTDNMYITAGYDELDIIKVSLHGTKIKIAAEAKLSGYVNNQYSMSEKDGMFRVATTINTASGMANRLYVLDENMNVVGKTKLFGKDESIKAVRYIDDMAYVITFEQTDPLFAIDLSDSANPVVTGKVKIDGFSSSLLPAGENVILGIGNSDRDYIKLVLFDVSDMNSPKVLDTKVYKYRTGEIQYNIKALLRDNTYDYYAFCYDYFTEDDENFESYNGVASFKIEDNKIVTGVDKKYPENDEDGGDIANYGRCISVDNYLYYLDFNSKMHSVKMADKIKSVENKINESIDVFTDEE